MKMIFFLIYHCNWNFIKKGGDYVLSFDDNMFRLAKMQETLLKVSVSNREENLKKYQELVTQIDAKAFVDILEKIKHIDEHSHSLEEELQYLEEIKNVYNQLLELQLSFKGVCELYGDNSLELSDLTQLNISYLDDRINAINGYLVNLKNIEENKKKLQELNEQLVNEERKKDLFTNRLKTLEDELIHNFMKGVI